MPKILIIDKCWQCFNCDEFEAICEHPDVQDIPTYIENMEEIPEWCPLNEAPEKDEWNFSHAEGCTCFICKRRNPLPDKEEG